MEAALFCPNSFTCKCPLHWAICPVWGFWLLLHYPYWILAKTSGLLLLPWVMWVAALALQGWPGPLHLLQLFIGGVDVGAAQLRAVCLYLDGILNYSACQLSSTSPQGQLSCFTQASGGGHLTCSDIILALMLANSLIFQLFIKELKSPTLLQQ